MGNKQSSTGSEQGSGKTETSGERKVLEEKAREIKTSLDKTAKDIQQTFDKAAKDIQTSFEGTSKGIQEKAKAFQNVMEEKGQEVQVKFKAFQTVVEGKTQEVTEKLGLTKKPVMEPEPPTVEDSDPKLQRLISTVGTGAEYTRNIAGLRLLPAGSAFYTSSGKLSNRGIVGIIHAATGSNGREGKGLSPTLKSVSNSVRNALILAQRHGHAKIAIPFIGGAIFLMRMFTSLEELATVIIRTAIEHKGTLKVALVPYGDSDTQLFHKVLEALLAEEQYASHRDGSIEVKPGDITMKNIHGAEVIVNAANTEAKFGGGLSGAIAHASNQQSQIDREAAQILASFIEAYVNQHH